MQGIRVKSWLASCLLVGAMAPAACGDDDGAHADATPDIDARIIPDGPLPTCEGTLDCPEGGEVRVEIVNCPAGTCPNAADNATRITSFFVSDADSGNTPDAFPPIAPGQCWDLSADDLWPTAQGENRAYIDVGGVAIGGPATPSLLVPPAGAVDGLDLIARHHTTWWVSFTGPNVLTDDASFNVLIGGSDDYPATAKPAWGYIPKAFDLIDPGLETVHLTPDTDATFTWEHVTSNTTQPVIGLVGFGLPGIGPQIVCPEIDDGSITVPAAMVNKLLALGTAGGMNRQTFVHVPHDFVVNGEHRRVDVLGVYCYQNLWTTP